MNSNIQNKPEKLNHFFVLTQALPLITHTRMSSSQPRRSPRLVAAEWKANAEAYRARRNASRVPAGPPNTFVSTVPSPPPVVTSVPPPVAAPVPDSTPPPRRSARLAEKLRKQVQDSTYAYVKPLFNQIDSTHDENERSRIVVQIYKYLIANPMALVLYPKFRETVVGKVPFLRSQIVRSSNIAHDTKISVIHCFRKFEMSLHKIRSHPYYVA
jgi:hypothetical protein